MCCIRDGVNRKALSSFTEYACQWMFFDWVENYRSPDPISEEEEVRKCPLIWCRETFDSKESVVCHVFECPRLSNAWYWCPYHERPEQFLEWNKLFRSRLHLEKTEGSMVRSKGRRVTGLPRRLCGQISTLCQSQASLLLARQFRSSISSRGSERRSSVYSASSILQNPKTKRKVLQESESKSKC